ncbi:UNVERIFIED_CONTAM: hypothetical protein Cloal_2395 [Acetivibrio alkalicellulosi]
MRRNSVRIIAIITVGIFLLTSFSAVIIGIFGGR